MTTLSLYQRVKAADRWKYQRILEGRGHRTDDVRGPFYARPFFDGKEFWKIVAVQAEGNYVSLRYRPSPYLVRESLSSMVEKLRLYGFIRIHRSILVNISAVEKVQPLSTGEYRLRVTGGKEYLVTRTYKHNLRDLAQLWVGSERLPG
jgi:hypothetical protein